MYHPFSTALTHCNAKTIMEQLTVIAAAVADTPKSRWPKTDTPQMHMLAHRIAEMEGYGDETLEKHFAFARHWCKTWAEIGSSHFEGMDKVDRMARLRAKYVQVNTNMKLTVRQEDIEFATQWIKENPHFGKGQ